MESPKIAQETEESVGLPKDEYKADPEMMEMVKKLARGESIEDAPEADEAPAEESDIDMKKNIIKKAYSKYLGR
jgi:hypothetical protein